MAIYFVDPVGGDNANDGLGPDTAFADFFQENTDVNDIPIYWVKRGATIVVDATKTINLAHVKSWPKTTDSWYADRPQAGIDAGWDTDADTLENAKVETVTENFNFFDVSFVDSAVLSFDGIDFHDGATNGTSNLFNLRSAKIDFNHCYFYGESTNLRVLCYRAAASSTQLDNGVVTLNDCVFENRDVNKTDSKLVDLYGDDDVNYKKHVILNRCRLINIGYGYYSVKSNGRYGRDIHFEINNSTLSLLNALTLIVNRYGGYAQYPHIYINNSTVTSKNFIFRTGYSNDWCQRWNKFYVRNSTLNAGQHIIEDYHSSSETSYYSTFDEVVFENSTLNAQRLYNNYAYNRTRFNSFTVKNCMLQNMNWIIYGYGFDSMTKTSFENNVFDEVENGFYANTSYAQYISLSVSMIGQNITGKLFSGKWKECNVYLENSNIGKQLCTENSKDFRINAINSSFDAVQGTGHQIDAISCRLSSSDGPALTGVRGNFSDCEIISKFSPLLSSLDTVVFDGCNITAPEITKTSGSVKNRFTKCVLNGTPTPFLSESGDMSISVSPINRSGGNPFSLSCSPTPKDIDTYSIVSDVFVNHLESKPNLTLYMTAASDIIARSSIIAKVSVVIEGILTVFPMTISSDSSTQWDGTQVGNIPFKATINVAGKNITEGARIKIVLALANKAEKVSNINIDTKVNQE